MTYKGRRPQNIKSGISQQPVMDLPQILNLSSGNQTKIENSSKWRQPPMEDNLKILKVEYLITSYPNLQLKLRWLNQN